MGREIGDMVTNLPRYRAPGRMQLRLGIGGYFNGLRASEERKRK